MCGQLHWDCPLFSHIVKLSEGRCTLNPLLGIAVLIHFSVNSQKRASAFPPNFIHGLDVTHMLLTALECRVRFPSCRMWELLTIIVVDPRLDVHDSYWTHPSSIDQMSTIIRDTFIALHSSDVLGRLLSEVTCIQQAKHPPTLTLRVGVVCIFYYSSTNDMRVTKSQLPP